NYGFWGAGFGDFLSQDKQHANPKITDTASGMMLGFDYYGYQNGIFTLASGYVHNDISEECCAGSGTSNGGMLSFYGTGNIGNGYIEGGFLGGYNRFNMQRNIALTGPLPFYATAESSFNTWTLMPHFSGGYDWMMDWGIVEPFGSVDWAVTFQESYKEKGAAPLNDKIKSQNPSILRSQLGINFYETWECEKHAFIFQQSASYINQALFSTKMSAAIILAPTAVPGAFTVWTYDQTLNLGGVGGKLFYKHKPSGFFVSGAYQGEFGTSFMSNDITGTLGVFF
ncbi:MAG TPA: autotransporter outer membrane beta-barrel domain-containing protein, partial [Chlamydiales bacterium]|nr:autotransporter outer membrane beta-barrel domain-containing protein [Chlamydiales bacterium]